MEGRQSGLMYRSCPPSVDPPQAEKPPLKLIHYEAYLLKEDASRREKFLKTGDGKKFLKQQLSVLFQQIGKI